MNVAECYVEGNLFAKKVLVKQGQYYIFPNTKLSEKWTLFNKSLNFYDRETVRVTDFQPCKILKTNLTNLFSDFLIVDFLELIHFFVKTFTIPFRVLEPSREALQVFKKFYFLFINFLNFNY